MLVKSYRRESVSRLIATSANGMRSVWATADIISRLLIRTHSTSVRSGAPSFSGIERFRRLLLAALNVRPRLNGINDRLRARRTLWGRPRASGRAAEGGSGVDFDNMWLYLEFPGAQVVCLLKIMARRSAWAWMEAWRSGGKGIFHQAM